MCRRSVTCSSPSYPLLYGDLVVVADRVLSQEVKLHHVLLIIHLGVQLDVLHPQRAAADGVCGLPFLLFVTGPQCELREAGGGTNIVIIITGVSYPAAAGAS